MRDPSRPGIVTWMRDSTTSETHDAAGSYGPHPAKESNMVSRDDIEGFLDRLATEGASYSEVEPGLWVVKPGGALDFSLVVHYSPPVVLLRVKVMQLPTNDRALATLSRRLLELNASELVHGSYGIEDSSIVITEALEL